MNDALRTLIKMSLGVRSVEDTAALINASYAGNVTIAEVVRIAASLKPREHIDDDTIAGNTIGVQCAARSGSEALYNATEALVAHTAKRHGVSLEGARLAALYSRAQIQRRLAA